MTDDRPATVPLPAARTAEGWHWPRGARAAHYLRGGQSLCGRWLCHPSVIQAQRAALPTDCAACRAELARPRSTGGKRA